MTLLMKFIENVREEKNGFSFDEPWQLEEKSLAVVIPILRKNEDKKKRRYLTFSEARKIKAEDTGQIDYIFVKNEEDVAVLISRGEIFKGKTQERAVIHDYLIPANSSLRVSVRCIHHSKGIISGTEMSYGGKIPYSVNLANQQQTWNTVTTHNFTYSNTIANSQNESLNNSTNLQSFQKFSKNSTINSFGGDYWAYSDNNNDNNSSFFNSLNGDDYVSTLESMKDSMKEIMQKIPFIENQVGAILFQKNDLIGMDVYDTAKSWEAVKNDIIEKEGSSFLEKNDSDLFGFSLRLEKVRKAIKAKLGGEEWTEKIIFDGDYKIIQLKSKSYLAEGLILDNEVLHFSLWKI